MTILSAISNIITSLLVLAKNVCSICSVETNAFDRDIAAKICDTVLYTVIAIGSTVLLCLIVAYRYRYFSRKIELEKNKPTPDNDVTNNNPDDPNMPLISDEAFESFNGAIEKIQKLSENGQEINLIFKRGDNSLTVKTPTKIKSQALAPAAPADSNTDSKDSSASEKDAKDTSAKEPEISSPKLEK